MTKSVRIENADSNTNYKVVVQIWDKGYPEGEPDTMSQEIMLNNPCDITGQGVYLTSTRYIIVKEKV